MEARLFQRRQVFEGWRIQVDGRGIATPAVWRDSVVFGGGFGSHRLFRGGQDRNAPVASRYTG